MPCRLNHWKSIRLLSNIETNRHKLLHIVLFGQPELDERLADTSMRQLKERITTTSRWNLSGEMTSAPT